MKRSQIRSGVSLVLTGRAGSYSSLELRISVASVVGNKVKGDRCDN